MDNLYSNKTKRIAKQFNLTVEQMAFIDLVEAGWDTTDAYAVTIRQGVHTWGQRALQDEIRRILHSQGAEQRKTEREEAIKQSQIEKVRSSISQENKTLLDKATNKETMLIDLQATLETTSPGSKEWLDIKKMIIDVSRMKQDEVKTEDTTIHYYLPVEYPKSCETCLIYQNRKKTG